MESPVRKSRFKFFISLLLIPAGIVAILASFQDYYEIKNGTANWNSKYAAPWYYLNPDGFFIYIILEAIVLLCVIAFAVAYLVTKKEKHWEIAMSLFILVQLAQLINKFIKG